MEKKETKQLESDLPDYTLEGVCKYHLYIAHALGDVLTAERISQVLQKYKIKCYTRHAKGTEAREATVIGRIKEGVLSSRKCLVLLTEYYLEDDWHKIEMEEVATKGHRFSPDTVIIAQSGTFNIPKPLKVKDFVVHPYTESEDWVKILAAVVLKEPVGTMAVLPRENMGHASAMGYYYGFLALVLPDFKQRLVKQNFEKYPEMMGKTIKKMLIIIPKSCVCPPALSEEGKIEFADRFVTRMATRAGNIARDYKSSIYRFFDMIVDENGQQKRETYFFVGELATPLLTMYETYMSGLANMTLDQLFFQREVFFFTLNRILSHPKNRHCNGQFKIIWWCDDVDEGGKVKQPLYDFLRPILRAELDIENREERDPSGKLDTDDGESTGTLEADHSKNIAASTEKTATYKLVDIIFGSNPYAYYETLRNPTYNFTHTPRGKCIIINIANFHKSDHVTANALSPRKGADQDSVYMETLFKSLSFDVELHRDPDVRNFEQILLTTHLIDHSAYDAFICVIMTHGKLGIVFASDGLPIKVLDIAEFFSDSKCPTLIGKPKMFFIQACQRGQSSNDVPGTRMQADKSKSAQSSTQPIEANSNDNVELDDIVQESVGTHDSPMEIDADPYNLGTSFTPSFAKEEASDIINSVSNLTVSQNNTPLSVVRENASLAVNTPASESEADSREAPTIGQVLSLSPEQTAALVPGAPDFLMSYSTLPGSISYRDTVAGSLYIQALANNLKQDDEIDRALKRVTADVKQKLKEKGEFDRTVYQNQLPFHLTTGMTKLLYLGRQSSS